MGFRGTSSPISSVLWAPLTAFVHRIVFGFPPRRFSSVGRLVSIHGDIRPTFRYEELVRRTPAASFFREDVRLSYVPWIPFYL